MLPLAEVPKLLEDFVQRNKTVRGRTVESASLCVSMCGGVDLEVWLATPKANNKEEFIACVTSAMQLSATCHNMSAEDAERVLRGVKDAEFLFDDEIL